MSPFSVSVLGPRVAAQCASYVALQRPDGAIERADWGLDDPGGTCSLVALCLLTEAVVGGADESAAQRALDYLDAYQRPSGLTDLRDCNFDSAPDAGFILQALCPAVWAAREKGIWPQTLARTEAFLRRMVAGTLTGGFHTPNHRWVMAAGLALAEGLFSDLAPQIRPVIESYLAEGFDLDADGAWLERSAGVYDAICARSLLFLAQQGYQREECLTAVARNLRLNLQLFHADATIETGLSRRQDHGTRSVPTTLVAPLLLAGQWCAEPDFLAAAYALHEKAPADAFSLLPFVLRHGEPPLAAPALPESYTAHFPTLGAYRLRRGERSTTVFAGTTRLLHAVFGAAELVDVKISQSYFGVGRFVGDTLEVGDDGSVTLRSEGLSSPYRPGYEQPLGRPVPPENYRAIRDQRTLRRLPPCTSTLTVRELPDGLELRYRTLDGMDRVPAQLALDFAPGGVWETDDTCFQPQAGQVVFLKRGIGRLRYGRDSVELAPGADSHRMWAMRDAETAPQRVRILLTFIAPVDHTLTLRHRKA